MNSSFKSLILGAALTTALCGVTFPNVEAAVRLPRAIGSGMVLQRGDTVSIWGWADAGEEVQVRFLSKRYKAVADADGEWEVRIPTRRQRQGGGPYTMQIGDVTLQDIYIGDVWLCSGQSNMDLHCDRLVDLYQEEFSTSTYPAIHLMQTARKPSLDGPQDDLTGGGGFYAWEDLRPEHVGHWSGIGYFLAKAMYEATGVPQGVISASMGGSDIVAWCSRSVLQANAPKYLADAAHLSTPGYLERNAEINRAIGQAYDRLYDEQDPGLSGAWMNTDVDDSDWESVNQYDPAMGDANGRAWRGSLWLRKHFTVPDSLAGQEALLRLGCLVDADVCYVNGTKVGETGYRYPPRKYVLGKNVLRAGDNVVCIRLKTGGGREKFVADKSYKVIWPSDTSLQGRALLGVTSGRAEVDLMGNWLLRRGVLMPGRPGVEGVSNGCASSLYDNVIRPLLRYRVAGIVWYQGETNAGRPDEYARLLPAMISDWRQSFGEVPAVICGLANYMQRHADAGYYGGWARLREAQRLSAERLPNAALATLADLGEWNDIHPLNKKEAARRIALQMRALKGEKGLAHEGPRVESVQYRDGQAIVTFALSTAEETLAVAPPREQHTSAGVVRTSGQLEGFTVAGSDGRYHWAEATVLPKDKGDALRQSVSLTCPDVPNPQHVRYGWDDDPLLTLYSSTGLPAAPFTSDNLGK